jgi:hypothetical protein
MSMQNVLKAQRRENPVTSPYAGMNGLEEYAKNQRLLAAVALNAHLNR